MSSTTQQATNSQSCTETVNGTLAHETPVINPAVAEIIGSALAQPTEAEVQRMDEIEELRSYVVDLETEYAEDETVIKINDAKAFGRKDLVCVKAKQKSGKTHFNAILIASTLDANHRWNEVECMIKNPRTLVVDTEQKKSDTQRVIRKAFRMAGRKPVNRDDLMVLNLRDVTSTHECCQRVEQAVKAFAPDLVILDGVVDLIDDFNDISSSQQLVRKLMKMADEGNCCIISVLHTNKSADDHNMRGHLGTILAQKASSVFECRKDAKSNIVQVCCTDYRHAPIPDFYFGFDHQGEVIPMTTAAADIKAYKEEQAAKKKANEEEKKLQERYDRLKEILEANNGYMVASSLRKAVEGGKILSKNYITDFLNTLVTRELLTLSADGKIYSLPVADDERYADPQCRLDLE